MNVRVSVLQMKLAMLGTSRTRAMIMRGKVGDLTNSCLGIFACQYVAEDGGQAGSITNSCKDSQACMEVGASGGQAGSITNSCLGEIACQDLAECMAVLLVV